MLTQNFNEYALYYRLFDAQTLDLDAQRPFECYDDWRDRLNPFTSPYL